MRQPMNRARKAARGFGDASGFARRRPFGRAIGRSSEWSRYQRVGQEHALRMRELPRANDAGISASTGGWIGDEDASGTRRPMGHAARFARGCGAEIGMHGVPAFQPLAEYDSDQQFAEPLGAFANCKLAEASSRSLVALLTRVGLAPRAGAYPARLSGGQAAAQSPLPGRWRCSPGYVFDEPTSALDPETGRPKCGGDASIAAEA